MSLIPCPAAAAVLIGTAAYRNHPTQDGSRLPEEVWSDTRSSDAGVPSELQRLRLSPFEDCGNQLGGTRASDAAVP